MTTVPATVMAAGATISDTARVTRRRLTSRWASLAAIVIATLWTLPTFGLLVTSVRRPVDIQTSGWWTTVTNPSVTLDNYREVLRAQNSGSTLGEAFLNSVVITRAISARTAEHRAARGVRACVDEVQGT